MSPLFYTSERRLSEDEFIDILGQIRARRAVEDRGRIALMLRHANLLCTARTKNVWSA